MLVLLSSMLVLLSSMLVFYRLCLFCYHVCFASVLLLRVVCFAILYCTVATSGAQRPSEGELLDHQVPAAADVMVLDASSVFDGLSQYFDGLRQQCVRWSEPMPW